MSWCDRMNYNKTPKLNLALLRFTAIATLTLVSAKLYAQEVKQNVRHSLPQLQALQISDFQSEMNSQQGELALRSAAIDKINALLKRPSTPVLDEEHASVFSALMLFNLDKKLALNKAKYAVRHIESQSPEVQREVLTAVYRLYSKELGAIVATKLPRLNTQREFAIAGFTVLKRYPTKSARHKIELAMHKSFPDCQTDPRLIELDHALHVDAKSELQQRPPLLDLLAAPIKSGYPVVYSFQRKNRNFFGLVMVRDAQGRFVRNADGSYFNVPQLARAGNTLPSSITNGNTPQGIFSIDGTGTSVDTIWIGPTPYLNSFLPIESSLSDFSHQADTEGWSEEKYTEFLPASWRNYFPIKEAWRAGLAGRNEILAHGTTVNSDYYRKESFYPGTPSAGCLVAMEYWSKIDGRLLHSDQLSLVKAFSSTGSLQGFMVVINLDDLPRTVVLADVIDQINLAQSQH